MVAIYEGSIQQLRGYVVVQFATCRCTSWLQARVSASYRREFWRQWAVPGLGLSRVRLCGRTID